jgi:hypothetical protein
MGELEPGTIDASLLDNEPRLEGCPMGWFISFLAIGVVALGAGFDRRRQRELARVARPDLNRWEEEGGTAGSSEG